MMQCGHGRFPLDVDSVGCVYCQASRHRDGTIGMDTGVVKLHTPGVDAR